MTNREFTKAELATAAALEMDVTVLRNVLDTYAQQVVRVHSTRRNPDPVIRTAARWVMAGMVPLEDDHRRALKMRLRNHPNEAIWRNAYNGAFVDAVVAEVIRVKANG